MKKSVFYIFDETCDKQKFVRYCIKNKISKIFLCPVTTNTQAVSSLKEAVSLSGDYEIKCLPYLDHFDKLSFLERDNFINFIVGFSKRPFFKGQRDIREYFKLPGSSFSIWWLSRIAEINPWKGYSFHDLMKLLTVLRLKEEYRLSEVITDIESKELALAIKNNAASNEYTSIDFKKYKNIPVIINLLIAFLKGLGYYLYVLYKVLVVSVNNKGSEFRREILKKAKYIIVTYFPLMDDSAFREKRFVNKYYAPLQRALENKYKDRLVWLALTTSINNTGFKKSTALGKDINTWNYPIYFLEEWLNLKDLFIMLVQYVRIAIKFFMNVGHISEEFRYSDKKIDIWDIFKKDWLYSFAGPTLVRGIMHYTAFSNVSRELGDDASVIYLAENQAWEKALNFVFRDKRKLKTIGIIHTFAPLLYLPYFNFEDDLEVLGKEREAMPKPDCLACNGRTTLRLLQTSSWGRKKAFLWFAMRYKHLKTYLEHEIPWNVRQNKILVALPLNLKALKEMLFLIHQAFKNEKDYRIIIKSHYGLPAQPIFKRLGLVFDKDIFSFTEERIDKILPSVKAMLVTGTSAALEAIALRCPIIVPKLSSIADMNPLSGISDLPIYVKNPEELKEAADNIMRSKSLPVSGDKCKCFIEDYFRFFENDNELMEELENCFAERNTVAL